MVFFFYFYQNDNMVLTSSYSFTLALGAILALLIFLLVRKVKAVSSSNSNSMYVKVLLFFWPMHVKVLNANFLFYVFAGAFLIHIFASFNLQIHSLIHSFIYLNWMSDTSLLGLWPWSLKVYLFVESLSLLQLLIFCQNIG